MSTRSILIFERDHGSASSLREIFATWGYESIVANNVPDALTAVNESRPTLVVDAGSISSPADFALVRALRSQAVDLPVVLLTEEGGVKGAIQTAQEEGVYHYFDKPIEPNNLKLVLDRAVELSQTKRENELLRRQLQDRGAFGELVGNSESMRKIYTLIEQVAPSSASVLITENRGLEKSWWHARFTG